MALTLDDGLLSAERACIGAVLLDPTRAAALLDVVNPTDFAHPAHQQVWAAVASLHQQGVEPEVVALLAALAGQDGAVDRDYLLDCIATAPTHENGDYLAAVVVDAAKKRDLGVLGAKIRHLSDTPISADELLSTVDSEVAAVHNRGARSRSLAAADFISDALIELETRCASDGMLGLPTGYKDLDEQLGGMREGQLILVAARPNVGKSTLATDVLLEIAVRRQIPAALFSLEMNADEITYKLLAAQSHIVNSPVLYRRLRDGELNEDDWDRLARSASAVLGAPLHCDDSALLTVPQLRAEARRLVRTKGVRFIVVDYLQLLTGSGRSETRQQEVSEMSRGLKLLAKELKITVMALCQLNRGPEQRADKRPQLSDLRESGSLEQDADIVLLLHRPEVSDPEERPGEMDVIVAKHRTGRAGGVVCLSTALLPYARFADSTGRLWDPSAALVR